MKYCAVEFATSPGVGDNDRSVEINDTSFWAYSPQGAWDMVAHIFSAEHTIVLDDDGRPHRFTVAREYPR